MVEGSRAGGAMLPACMSCSSFLGLPSSSWFVFSSSSYSRVKDTTPEVAMRCLSNETRCNKLWLKLSLLSTSLSTATACPGGRPADHRGHGGGRHPGPQVPGGDAAPGHDARLRPVPHGQLHGPAGRQDPRARPGRGQGGQRLRQLLLAHRPAPRPPHGHRAADRGLRPLGGRALQAPDRVGNELDHHQDARRPLAHGGPGPGHQDRGDRLRVQLHLHQGGPGHRRPPRHHPGPGPGAGPGGGRREALRRGVRQALRRFWRRGRNLPPPGSRPGRSSARSCARPSATASSGTRRRGRSGPSAATTWAFT